MKKLKNIRVEDKDDYWCRNCGEKNNVYGHYSQTEYGTVQVVSSNGETGDYDPHDWDDFCINEYACENCGRSAGDLNELITDDEEDVWEILYGEKPWTFNPSPKKSRKRTKKS
jgi:hypothetical protein